MYSNRVAGWWGALGACLLNFLLAARTLFGADPFEERLQGLVDLAVRTNNPATIERACEAALKDFPDHPERARIMLLAADGWEVTNKQLGVVPDEPRALGWFRRAVAAAPVGSQLWSQAQLLVAARIRESSPAEAKNILHRIESKSSDQVVRAQVLHDLQLLAMIEGDSEEAERRCRRLMEWHRQPGNTPKEPLRKARIDRIRASGAAAMMFHWAEMQVPKAQRRAKIDAFERDYGAMQSVWSARELALEYLAKAPDVAAAGPPRVNRTGQYAAVAVVVLSALATVVLFRIALRRRRSVE
jgi:hypothetical protein